MLRDGKIWVANNEAGDHIYLLPRMANRHGLIAGATGTGKTVTARVLAEAFSDMGVPVFMADVKGDLAGIMSAGADSPDMQERISSLIRGIPLLCGISTVRTEFPYAQPSRRWVLSSWQGSCS